MNPEQQEALSRVSQILGEHFDANIVAVQWETLNPQSQELNTASNYDGGVPTAIGLCEVLKQKLINTHLEGF